MEITLHSSLANTKRISQAFANLVFDEHNQSMDIIDIRRQQLKKWFARRKIPDKEKSYISQLINGKSSFGEKAARRLEDTYKMPDKYLDNENESIFGIDETKLTLKQKEIMKKISLMNDEELTMAEDVFKIVGKKEKSENEQNG